MTSGKASGGQITFFIFATWLIAVPLTRAVENWLGGGPRPSEWLERGFHNLLVAAGLFAIAPLRRQCIDALRVRISAQDKPEVVAAIGLSILAAFGFIGAYALWWFAADGPAALEQRISALGRPDVVLAESLRPGAIATQVIMAVGIVPIVEELLFRRFLFRAWAESRGWIVAMILSSTVFGLLHTYFLSAFLASIVFTCVYRRTGSLRAAIVVHAAHNLLVYYPLLGRYIVPLDLEFPGDLASWTWHLLALVAIGVLLPAYAWISNGRASPIDEPDFDHVPLPR